MSFAILTRWRGRWEKEKAWLLTRYQAELKTALRRQRDELTKAIPGPHVEGTCYPLGRPEHPRFSIAETPRIPHHLVDWMSPDAAPYLSDEIRIHSFKVKQFAYVLPDGTKVIWFGLEPV